jgi:Fe-S-cluster containining protein
MKSKRPGVAKRAKVGREETADLRIRYFAQAVAARHRLGVQSVPMQSQHEEARGQTFGYVCGRCSQCCRSHRYDVIHVNPYEIARLARNRNLSTSDFRARLTQGGEGTTLARTAENVCVFLSGGSCSVHADRPLVCRLYPLGRTVDPQGQEEWKELAPVPETKGTYTQKGTIRRWIESQGALPYLAAADAYGAWIARAQKALSEGGETLGPTSGDLLDMDGMIEAHCLKTGAEEPKEIEDRLVLHLKILDAALAPVEGGSS